MRLKDLKPEGSVLVTAQVCGDSHEPFKITLIFDSKADLKNWLQSQDIDLSAYYK
jgi:heme/copper-type cytochrome/quinol oxidase subunit 2